MKSFPALLAGLLLATTAAAQDGDTKDKPNPWLDRPAPELRQRLADLQPVFQESWYQVEALIFARVNPVTHEYWRLDQVPEFVANPIYLAGMPRPERAGDDSADTLAEEADIDAPLLPEEADGIDRAAVNNGAWRPLDAEALDEKVLAAMRDRMESRGGYRILFHEAWRQPIREKGRAFAVHVQGGEPLPPLQTGMPVSPLNPPVDESAPLQREETAARELAGADGEVIEPVVREHPVPEMRGELKLYLARYLHVEPNLWFTDESADGQRFHVVIEQHRRMRSEELHYLDHPLFGLLLYIKPWKTPEQEEAERIREALEQQMQRQDG